MLPSFSLAISAALPVQNVHKALLDVGLEDLEVLLAHGLRTGELLVQMGGVRPRERAHHHLVTFPAALDTPAHRTTFHHLGNSRAGSRKRGCLRPWLL